MFRADDVEHPTMVATSKTEHLVRRACFSDVSARQKRLEGAMIPRKVQSTFCGNLDLTRESNEIQHLVTDGLPTKKC